MAVCDMAEGGCIPLWCQKNILLFIILIIEGKTLILSVFVSSSAAGIAISCFLSGGEYVR